MIVRLLVSELPSQDELPNKTFECVIAKPELTSMQPGFAASAAVALVAAVISTPRGDRFSFAAWRAGEHAL